MAVVALPAALALIGGAAFAWSTTAIAAGWLIGSWIYSATQGSKNEILDTGAQEMPRVNQSLRGATMQVMFGTNRVSPNIVWLNDWTTIRHETDGGGGKGGGSGMGGKGGGSSSVSYEYRYDILFHFGMTPEPYNVFGGWIGSDKLGVNTIAAIIASTGNLGGSFDQVGNTSKGTAYLNFDDSFFGPGGPTNSSIYSNWTHFETVEGVVCRWPHTVYIGFQQLSLGSTSNIPQLTFEIGPGQVDIEYEHDFIADYPNTDGLSGGSHDRNGRTDKFGQSYWTNGGDIHIMDNTADMIGVLTTTQVRQDVVDALYTEMSDSIGIFGLEPFVLYDGEYILICSGQLRTDPPLNEIRQWFMLYTPVEGDVPVFYKASWRTAVGQSYVGRFGFYDADVGADKSSDVDYILLLGSRGLTDGDSAFLMLNPPLRFEDTPPITSITWKHGEVPTVTYDFPSSVKTNFAYRNGTEGYGNFETGKFFTLPKITISEGIPLTTSAFFWLGKGVIEFNSGAVVGNKCQWIHDNYVEDYPDGVMISFDFGILRMSDEDSVIIDPNSREAVLTLGEPIVENLAFDVSMPPGDEYLDIFGDTGTSGDAYFSKPYVLKAGPFNYAIIMQMLYRDAVSSNGWREMYSRWHAWFYDGTQQKFTKKVKQTGLLYLDSDLQVSAPLNGYDDSAWQVFYDIETGAIYVHSFLGASASLTRSNYRYVSKFGNITIGGGADVLPPYIIYQILTSPIFGASVSEESIDQDSYSAALQYCEDEGIRISTTYTREQNLLTVLNDLLSLYSGFLIESGGIIKFAVAALSTDPVTNPDGSARVIDNDHLVVDEPGTPPVKISRAARQDTFNTVKINYLDRALSYRQNIYEVADEVDVDLTGRRVREYAAQFVMTEDTAARIATRALWTNLYARDVHEFTVSFKDSDLEPGDVVTLVDSFHDELSTGRDVRIVNWKETKPGRFDVKAVTEIPYYNNSEGVAFDVSSASKNRNVTDEPLPAADFRMYELPKEFNAADGRIFVGYNQLMTSMGAWLYLSADDTSYALISDTQPYIISGRLRDGLPARENGYVEQNVQFYLMPASGFASDAPTFAQTYAMDDVGQAGRALGAGIFIAGSEALAVEGLTLLGQNHYKADKVYRGWGGTAIHEHSSGAYWHKHGAGMFTQAINEDKIGTTIYYKVVPYNFRRQGFDISSIEGKSYVVQGTYWRPQVPPNMKMFVDSPVTISNSEAAMDNVHVISGGSDVTFVWPDASRLEGYGQGGNGANGYGHFADDTLDVIYRVEVLSSDLDTVVRCLTVSTGFWTYERATNSADFNEWSGNFAVKMTPHNSYGDALRSQTRIVNLF